MSTAKAVMRKSIAGRMAAIAMATVGCAHYGAYSDAAEVRLAWDPPTNNTDGTILTDLAGFKLCWGTNSGVYTAITNVGNSTTGTVSGLTDGWTYYFVVRAFNATLDESSNSVELVCQAPVPIPPDTVPPVIQVPSPVTLTAGLDDKAYVPDFLTALSVTDDRTARTNLLLSQSPIAGYPVTIGTSSVTIAATDQAGNRSQVAVSLTVLKANRAPVVSAGADIIFRVDKSGILSGSVTDDGLPAGSTVAATWSKISGPGTVTFGNTNSPGTSARASVEGIYVLQLYATDQQLSGTDTVTVTVLPQPVPGKPGKVRVVMTTQDATSSTSTVSSTSVPLPK